MSNVLSPTEACSDARFFEKYSVYGVDFAQDVANLDMFQEPLHPSQRFVSQLSPMAIHRKPVRGKDTEFIQVSSKTYFDTELFVIPTVVAP